MAEKAVYKSVFLTTWNRILSAELTKTQSFRFCFFGDFAHSHRISGKTVYLVKSESLTFYSFFTVITTLLMPCTCCVDVCLLK